MRYLRMAIVLSLIFLSPYAWAEKRVALVIGNSAYQHAPQLANPQNDASDMASKLTGLGFVVVTGRELDLTDCVSRSASWSAKSTAPMWRSFSMPVTGFRQTAATT
ncbi:caspase family protein [Ensifer sp. ENS01]|nr:caspase family protein [Ensifer sp. ENS01]MBD9496399.1 caspase family protein [Ensifer sp. ENS01]